MKKEEVLDALDNTELDMATVDEYYETFKDDTDVVAMVAMNLSRRTSVYERDREKSELMERLLVKLSDASDMGTRWAVAKNPHTPVAILEKLAKDEVNLVRALVATNPLTPQSCLVKFFSDEKIVRDGLSGNPATPEKYLKLLSADSDKMVRMRVAENPATPKEVLRKLLDDGDENVKKAAEVMLRKSVET